jgi:hypothetical protein
MRVTQLNAPLAPSKGTPVIGRRFVRALDGPPGRTERPRLTQGESKPRVANAARRLETTLPFLDEG